jgi:choline dehydrogenase-like flavoprotein
VVAEIQACPHFLRHRNSEQEYLVFLPMAASTQAAFAILFPMAAKVFDVVIVGSGAAGGTLAAHLARRGADVAVVEGGPKINTRTDFNTHALPFEFPNRSIPTMRPGKPGFESERARGVGGKTLTWNAVAWRFSQRDFKGRTLEGAGEDWPLDYKDLAPYYEAIEREVGVCGNRDGLEDLPDGIFQGIGPASPGP